MCNCYDGDPPSVYTTKTRKARKEHRCCECGKAISVGAKYEHVSGIWDGTPDSFKTCLRCVVLREAHIKAEEAVQEAELDVRYAEESRRYAVLMSSSHASPTASPRRHGRVEPCRPIIGDILQAIGECAREEPAYVQEFRKARKSLLAERML